MSEQKNSITTEVINQPKKKAVKKNTEKNEEVKIVVEKNKKENKENMLVFFESGCDYTTGSGITFSQQNKMEEISIEEANFLLRLDNFRLPNDEEKEMYYNNLEV